MTFILQLLKLQVSTEFILAVSYPITTNSALEDSLIVYYRIKMII